MEHRLIELLSVGDWRLAETVIAAQPTEAAPHTLKMLLHEPPFDDATVRVAFGETWDSRGITSFNMVLGGLIEAAGLHVLDGLILALEDSRWNVRQQAALGLARLGSGAAQAVGALDRWLSIDDRRLRAIDTLGHIGPAAISLLPKLVLLLQHADPYVRGYTVTALGLKQAKVSLSFYEI